MTADSVTGDGANVRFSGLSADLIGVADQRPPLVLLHGLSFDRSMWKPALSELRGVDPERRTLLLDLPGHGSSDSLPSYAMDDVVETLHRAIGEAELAAPVMVGHSLAAIIASTYATRHATSGVVNVDQSLRTQQFSEFLRSMAEQLRSPAFPAIWGGFVASMHIELLPPDAQQLLNTSSTPRQDLVLGYWHDVLTRPPEAIESMAEAGQAMIRTERLPYMIVMGDEVEPAYRDWLHEQLPHSVVKVLPGSGHFPQLAHPHEFALCLAETAQWPFRR